MSYRPQCRAITSQGERCSREAVTDEGYCEFHELLSIGKLQSKTNEQLIQIIQGWLRHLEDYGTQNILIYLLDKLNSEYPLGTQEMEDIGLLD